MECPFPKMEDNRYPFRRAALMARKSADQVVNVRGEIGKPPVRLAIIGCGRVVEQCHLPALRTIGGLMVAALCDTDVARLGRIADRFGVRRRYTEYRAMLEDGGFDVVAVCTPPERHTEISLAALDAGQPLFVEK